MNDDRLDAELRKCFQNKYIMDDQMKIRIERMAYEKRERTDNLLLYIIQAAACLLNLLILVVAFIINRGMIMPVILIGYTMGSIISIVIALISNGKQNVYKEEKII